jgi:hypothetical protein
VRAWRIWLGGLILLAGCEPAANPDMVPVKGTVTYKDKPVAGANVVFQSSEQGSFGVTDEQGRFQLQTFAPGDGAPPGEYKVLISKMQITVPEFDQGDPQYVPPPPPKHLIPAKYADANTSGLRVTLVKGEPKDIPFELRD